MSETNNNTEQQRAVAIREYSEIEEIGLPVEKVLAQVQRVQEVMRAVMKEGEHYGTIPGCAKPSLYKPGAEKLGFTFRLAPKFEVTPREFGNGHREYEVVCRLYTINGEKLVGEGVGSCSTLEAKYRYRTGPKESTGKPVPKEYWDLRKTEPAKALSVIGGKGFSVAKGDDGSWEVVRQGEKMEHDNPADYYNTVLKMAKKRAHVDAILTATAASDIFTQDVEEMVENHSVDPAEPPKSQSTIKPPQAKAAPKASETNGGDIPEHDGKFTGTIDKYTAASGKSPAKISIRGESLSTFDRKLAEVAEVCERRNVTIDAFWKENKGFKNLVHIEARPEAEQQRAAGELTQEESPF